MDMGPEDLLDRVVDKETFLAFAWAMCEEAEQAEQLCRDNPEKFRYDDPLGWAHLSASGVLGGLISELEGHGDKPITWRDAAEFLYRTKIIE
jgi:hypothetical protein